MYCKDDQRDSPFAQDGNLTPCAALCINFIFQYSVSRKQTCESNARSYGKDHLGHGDEVAYVELEGLAVPVALVPGIDDPLKHPSVRGTGNQNHNR